MEGRQMYLCVAEVAMRDMDSGLVAEGKGRIQWRQSRAGAQCGVELSQKLSAWGNILRHLGLTEGLN